MTERDANPVTVVVRGAETMPRVTNLETAIAATFFHTAIFVFLSVHSLTGAFSCCNFYVYVVFFL